MRNQARQLDTGLTSWAAALAFPLVLWWVATLFLGGDLGKYGDDYDFQQRDPVTGSWSVGSIVSQADSSATDYFWRPLHVRVTMLLQTALWEHDRLNHIISAVAHLGAAVLLGLLIRRIGLSSRAAVAGSLVLLLHPMTHEVALWPSSTSLAWGTSTMLAGLLVATSGWAARRPLTAAVLMGPWAFVTACWYEPPAMALLCVPLVMVMHARVRDERGVMRAATVAGLSSALGIVTYVLLVIGAAPPEARGGAGSLTTLEQFGERGTQVMSRLAELVALRGYLPGAWVYGWEGREGVAWVGIATLAAAAGIVWSVWWSRSNGGTETEPIGARWGVTRAAALAVVIGCVIVALSMVPVAAIKHQQIVPRLAYVPLVGIGLMFAGVLHAFEALMRPARGSAPSHPMQRWPRAVGAAVWTCIGVAIVSAAGASSVAMVGFQERAQARSRLDDEQLRHLVERVPSPPRDAVFVSLWSEDIVAATGSPRFDVPPFGVLELPWSINAVRFAYKRDDVQGIGSIRWRPQAFAEVTTDGVLYRSVEHLRGRYSPSARAGEVGESMVPWEKIVPFVVGRRGDVHLVSEIRVLKPDNRDLVIPIASTRSVAGAARFDIADPEPVRTDALEPLECHVGLTAEGALGPRADIARVQEAGAWMRATRMHPESKTVRGMSELVAEAPGSRLNRGAPADVSQPSLQLHFRAMMPRSQVFSDADTTTPRGDGVVIEVSLVGDSERVIIEQFLLQPQRRAEHRGWVPVSVALPQSDGTNDLLSIRVLPGAAHDATFDGVFITQPYVEPAGLAVAGPR